MNRKGFTLVELIVVITILAILWTIAFLSLQWYAKNARDSKRVWDVNNIKKSLELFVLQTEKYPLPDNGEEVTYSWEVVWTQWTVWDNVLEQLSRNLKKKPLDPSTEEEYIYSTTENRREYEVLWIYEWWITTNSITNKAHASDTWYIKVDGTYNQLYTSTDSFIIPTPSLITSEELPLVLDSANIKSQVVTGQLNRPARTNTVVQTGWLDIVLSVYTGSIKETSTAQEKIDAIVAVQNAYTWTTLATLSTYTELLSQTDIEDQVRLANIVSLHDWDAESAPAVVLTWRDFDANCPIDDIVIAGQTWAGCNSTLWNGQEWWKLGNGSNANIAWCGDYSSWVWPASNCPVWDPTMASNANTKTFFDAMVPSGSNSNGDAEFETIWGKFYTYANIDSACPSGWHPAWDTDWQTLEAELGCTDFTNTAFICRDYWWWNKNTRTEANNVAEALKLPLSGMMDNGWDFNTRGRNGLYWSATDAWYTLTRNFYAPTPHIIRNYWNPASAMSARCVKD
jgi:uncharacterized protein (TIGR02145 family)/prepilin-type N-terminal cleavage/methylation domain-containing protein